MTSPVLRQLRDFAIGALVAVIIATCAFVAVRNTELRGKQIELATRAVTAIVEGKAAVPGVHGVLVGDSAPSKKHALLRQRQVLDGGTWRALTSQGSPDDKLFYDAASRIERYRVDPQIALVLERTGLARGTPFVELLRDGSGRAIAWQVVAPPDAGAAAQATQPPATATNGIAIEG
jgi:hypothetical protein